MAAPVVAPSGRFDFFTESRLWCLKKIRECRKQETEDKGEELEVMRQKTREFAKTEEEGVYPDLLVLLFGKCGLDRFILGNNDLEDNERRQRPAEETAMTKHTSEVKSMSMSGTGPSTPSAEDGAETARNGDEE